MGRGSNGHAPVPVEVWGQVARFLSLREHCMLASTCRALWTKLDLPHVMLTGEHSTAQGEGAF